MATPSLPPNLNRRQFMRLSALVAGSLTFADLLAAEGRSGLPHFDTTNGWLFLETEIALYGDVVEQHLVHQSGGAAPTISLTDPPCPFDIFFDRSAEVFRAVSSLESLGFNNYAGTVFGMRVDAARLAACPQLARVRNLAFIYANLGGDGLRALAASPYLSELRCLCIYDLANPIGDEGIRALVESPYLTNLTHLELHDNHIGPEGVRALAASPRLPRLAYLELFQNEIGDEGAAALARSPHTAGLTHLYLACNGIGPAGARALAESRHLSRLTQLELYFQEIGAAGRTALERRFGKALAFDDDRGELAAREAAWLRPILQRPDDDAPRLRAAELLAATGDARAELLRSQCELAAAPEYDGRRAVLETRVNNLLAAYAEPWLDATLPNGNTMPWYLTKPPGWLVADRTRDAYQFRRGLVEHLRSDARKWVTFGPEQFRVLPGLRGAGVICNFDGPEWLQKVAAYADLSRLTTLELSGLDDEGLSILARSRHLKNIRCLRLEGRIEDAKRLAAWLSGPNLARLTTLDLRGLGLGVEGLRLLAAAGWGPAVTDLDLSDNYVGDEGAALLAAAPAGAALRRLRLRSAGVGDDGAAALAGARLANLRSLDLSHNDIGAAGAAVLTALLGLEVFALMDNPLGDEGVAGLVAGQRLAGLRLLNLAKCDLGPDSATALAQAPQLADLSWLDLGENHLGDAGAVALAASPVLRRLTNLEVNDNDLGPDGAAALGSSAVLIGINALNLSDNPSGNAAAVALAASAFASELRLLSLTTTGLTATGAAALAASDRLPHLTTLQLYENALDDAAARALAKSPRLRGLEVLSVAINKIGDDGARALAASASLANLIGLDLRALALGEEVQELLKEKFGSRMRLTGWHPFAGQPSP